MCASPSVCRIPLPASRPAPTAPRVRAAPLLPYAALEPPASTKLRSCCGDWVSAVLHHAHWSLHTRLATHLYTSTVTTPSHVAARGVPGPSRRYCPRSFRVAHGVAIMACAPHCSTPLDSCTPLKRPPRSHRAAYATRAPQRHSLCWVGRESTRRVGVDCGADRCCRPPLALGQVSRRWSLVDGAAAGVGRHCWHRGHTIRRPSHCCRQS